MLRSPPRRLPLRNHIRTTANLSCPIRNNGHSLALSDHSACTRYHDNNSSSCLCLSSICHKHQQTLQHQSQPPPIIKIIGGESLQLYQQPHRQQHLSRSSNPAPVRFFGSFRTDLPRGISSSTGNSARPRPPGISRLIVEKPSLFGPVNIKFTVFPTMQSTSAAPASSVHIPPRRPSPGPLSVDFQQQQIIKQQHSNYHSTSLKNMVSAASVNRTALHPGGVQ